MDEAVKGAFDLVLLGAEGEGADEMRAEFHADSHRHHEVHQRHLPQGQRWRDGKNVGHEASEIQARAH